MKRSIDEISQTPASDQKKTEKRRSAMNGKKEHQRNRTAGKDGVRSTKVDKPSRKGKKTPKAKMTKEERRKKYTQMAYQAREKQRVKAPGTNNTRCLGCRAWGHILANCPEAKANTGICFNCGSNKHALRNCPVARQKDGSLPHATCFVCKQKGHLSAGCNQNANGIYPKGGSCKGCGSKHHLLRDCPDRPKSSENGSIQKEKTAISPHQQQKEGEEGAGRPGKSDRRSNNAGSQGFDGTVGEPVVNGEGQGQEAAGGTKRRKGDSTGSSAAGDAKTDRITKGAAARARFGGGDDLEDDDYFEADDVPPVAGRKPAESEVKGEPDSTASGPSSGPRSTGGKKMKSGMRAKSKVVVF